MADFTTVARPYAQAIFDIAVEAGDLDGWSAALAVAAAIVDDDAARRYLSRPELGAVAQAEFIVELCSGAADASLLGSKLGRNLLLLLSENGRLNALPAIAERFEVLKAEQENKVKVTLVASTEVDSAQAEKVAAGLKRRLGREIELEIKVDPSLLGGAIIRAQDMVIDGSLRTRLKRLAGSLIG
jgi:F-type H+-transporting ATPase subunit delta